MWTPDAIHSEMERLKPVLKALGLKTPLRRARALLDLEADWEDEQTQSRWESRIAFWRGVLLGEDEGFGLPELIDLHPSVSASGAGQISEDGKQAEATWADHMRARSGVREYLEDKTLRDELIGTQSWGIYREDGSHDPQRAEDLVASRPRIHNFDPPEMDAQNDYDYLVQHPKDRLFQIVHQNNWVFVYLAMAQYHGPDDRWVDQFVRMIAAHIDHCPRLPDGANDFGTGDYPERPSNCAWVHRGYAAVRVIKTLMTYLLMKDSPRLSDRFHAVLLRYLVAHVRHIHDLGEKAYSDNYLVQCGKAVFLTGVLLPELREADAWMACMWKNFTAGMERELLPDGTHFHRAFGYHCGFVGNPVAMVHLGRRIDPGMEFPERFTSLTQLATQSLVSVLTPTFTTPGINDDFTADIVEKRDLLHLASEAFERDDWRYLVSEGRTGTRPETLSVLLPDAQLVAMRSAWSSDAHYLLFNVSPDGGHHHPDTLSIQIYAGGRRLLTEPGCGHYYTGEREQSKRSWWHNCPTLGEKMLPSNPAPQVLHWETSADLDYAVGQISVECEGGEALFRRHVYFIHRRYWILFDEFDLPDGEVVWENFHFPVQHVSIPQDGLSVEVKDEQGAGLTMVVGQARWKVEREQASRWLMYGDPPQSTTVLHYEADAETAGKGFVALFVPSRGPEDVVEAGVEGIETRKDGSTAITVKVSGERHEVVTWAGVASG